MEVDESAKNCNFYLLNISPSVYISIGLKYFNDYLPILKIILGHSDCLFKKVHFFLLYWEGDSQ